MDTTITRTVDRRGKTITTFVIYDAAAELNTMVEGDVLVEYFAFVAIMEQADIHLYV